MTLIVLHLFDREPSPPSSLVCLLRFMSQASQHHRIILWCCFLQGQKLWWWSDSTGLLNHLVGCGWLLFYVDPRVHDPFCRLLSTSRLAFDLSCGCSTNRIGLDDTSRKAEYEWIVRALYDAYVCLLMVMRWSWTLHQWI